MSGLRTGGCFREHCGTPVSDAHDDDAGWIDVTVGSRGAAAEVALADQRWAEDRLPWMTALEGLPVHPRSRRER